MSAADDAPEAAYAASADPAHRRRLAQYFTPFPVAAFMARWVAGGSRAATVLDPALGLGVFARALARESAGSHRVTGYEVDPGLADRAAPLLAGLPGRLSPDLRRGDFLASGWEERWDAVLCNPPYLRFQDYPARGARLKALEERMGVRLRGLTNLHCLFLLKGLHQLEAGGRAAYVMPWEFLNAGYGERIKAWLLESGMLRHAVIFDSARGLFAGALTTACILLLERTPAPESIRFHRARAGEDLDALYRDRIAGPGVMAAGTESVAARGMVAGAKWRGYWQGTSTEGYPGMVPLGTFATVLRGIATGSNAFFTLDEAERAAAGLPADCLLPCVAKARDAAGPLFGPADFEALRARGRKAWLLDAEGRAHPAVAAYLEAGRAAGVHERFLTRHRSPWYALERRPPAPLWVSVFNRGTGLKAVLNRAGARNLTAFHCVYPKPGAAPFLEPLFAWLLTGAAKAILRAGGRGYGGGLEKIEPRDLAGAPVPDFSRLGQGGLAAVAALVRDLEAGPVRPEAAAARAEGIFADRLREP